MIIKPKQSSARCNNILQFTTSSAIFLALIFAITATSASADQPGSKSSPGKNIALGKKYTFSPKPTYQYCTDPGDTTQLTDGQLTDGYFWVQKGCVGWHTKDVVTITFDLGHVEPISGVSFRTAAGAAGVTWPAAIEIAVSDDGKNYRLVGELVELAFQQGISRPTGYGVRQLITDQLHTRGRIVKILVMPSSGCYVFCDEIEIFRGPNKWLEDDPGGRPLGDINKRAASIKIKNAFRSRYAADVAAARQAVDAAKLSDASVKQALLKRIADAEKGLRESTLPENESFRAILPFNKVHAELFAVQAALWKAQGRPPLTATAVNPWDPSELFTTPPPSGGRIELHAIRGEYRAAALNLANSLDRPITVRLSIKGLPGGATPEYLTVSEVPWTDTGEGRPVMAALPEVEAAGGCWTIKVLPGLVRQVWFTLHAKNIPHGRHQGQILIESDSSGVETMKTPLALTIYPVDLPKETTLEVGGWSYTNGSGSYGITPENRRAFLRHLQDRFVNAPWANNGVLMSFKFNDKGKIELDTRQMDAWLAQWPNARQYYVFMSLGGGTKPVRQTFAGTKLGTPEFDLRVGAWITAWVEHLKTKGIQPHQLGILFFDEPTYESDAASIIKWIKAVKAAQPGVKSWIDPIYKNPSKGSAQLMAICDTLCPNRPMWLTHKKSFEKFYGDQKRQGRELQFYSCSGPARLLDPYAYYRLQAWHCWKIGGTGSFFWAFGDNGRASSWTPYMSVHGPFTPLYLDKNSVTAGKHMEAIRESVEDFETLMILEKILKQAKADGRKGSAVETAQQLLETAAGEVLDAENVDKIRWHIQKNRDTADHVRVKILKAIVDLQ
ncbi:MAG: discoidin domain-containing protein [Pirellulales bacterium]|nr:discoidin domain-containing protein [Pirellulales bacterium]